MDYSTGYGRITDTGGISFVRQSEIIHVTVAIVRDPAVEMCYSTDACIHSHVSVADLRLNLLETSYVMCIVLLHR